MMSSKIKLWQCKKIIRERFIVCVISRWAEGEERIHDYSNIRGIVVLFTKLEEETLGLEWRKWGLKLELTEFKMEHLGKAIQDLVEFNRDMKFRRKILADIIM